MDPRAIEYDGLALAMFALGFVAVASLVAAIVGNAAQRMDAAVVAAGAAVAAAVIAAWIFGYPRHATAPAIALVLLVAMSLLPLLFDMNGAVLREAKGAPLSRVYVAMGLYVGGLGVGFLAFLVAGFLGPLVGAGLRLKRGEEGARGSLMLHLALTGVALAIVLPALLA